MSEVKTYVVRSRWLSATDGWQTNREVVNATFMNAGLVASRTARALDEEHGNSHFWTVDLLDEDTDGSYYQLFPGRLA
jgi:hypothetical protein